jgi:hypothetical protein
MLVIELDSSRARLTRSSGLILWNRLFLRDGGALYSTPVRNLHLYPWKNKASSIKDARSKITCLKDSFSD